MSLKGLGWDSYFEAQWQECKQVDAVPARVVSQQRGLWRLALDFAECWAAPSGKMRRETEKCGAWPAVGDWVAVEIAAGKGRAVIHRVLPRRSQFARKVAGRAVEQQVIAANVDTALIVMALDGDFNLRRVERYLAQCWDSGARAVMVLNKADACDNIKEHVDKIERVALGTASFVVSAKTGQGLDALQSHLKPGQTIALLGSSGVGKSTLLNYWLGREAQRVREVREKDSRGRHTTTTRELFVLPRGAIVIDTPGLRELQLWDAEIGIAQAFADIEDLAAQCRFRNCEHTIEPGCAVQAALAAGQLDPARLENRRKLEREQEFLRRKTDPAAAHAEKEKNKVLHRAARRIYDQRKREGGKE
jgi:ribosome biogenesis GTPase / thiamine phosphate phosphatase